MFDPKHFSESHALFKPEEFQFSLHYAGRLAGTERWISGFEKNQFVIRLETVLQSPLGNGQKRVQTSKLEPSSGFPNSYQETGDRPFETIFDRRSGLVTVKQNRDEASIALTQDYHDPVSLLQLLRELPDEISVARVPMVGGMALVTRLEDEVVSSPWGEVLARVYYVRPGVNLVYIEANEPYRPLKFTQTLGKYALEAILTRTTTPQNNNPANRRDSRESNRDQRGNLRSRPGQPAPARGQQQRTTIDKAKSGQSARQDQRPAQQTRAEVPKTEETERKTGRKRRRFRKRSAKTEGAE
jgi:hypothetical protein